MDLPEFVNSVSGVSAYENELLGAGPATNRLYERIGNEGLTRSLLATNFWRSWLSSVIAEPLLRELGAYPGVISRSRTIIVWRQDRWRFDLVVLDPALSGDFVPRATSVNPTLLNSEWIMAGASESFREAPMDVLGTRTDAMQLAQEVNRGGTASFSVIYGREPATERLVVPLNPLSINNPGNSLRSTAGAFVDDLLVPGRSGLTAALHAVEATTSVDVEGNAGTVVRTDSITDSAFIEVPSLTPFSLGVAGALSGMAPRGNQVASFVGATSRHCQTTITAWDSQIPNPSARRQACVYTRRDAQPGDSGAALVTDDNWLVGFGFERTKPGEVPAQCSWIWAESVLNRLNLKLH